MRYARQSLAEACFVATRGDFLGALELALDIQRIAAEPRWPLNDQGPGPKGREAARTSPKNLTLGAGLPESRAPRPLKDAA